MLVDIAPGSLNLDPEQTESKLRERDGKLRAILPVHLYGQCADMDAFRQLGSEFGLVIIEDAANPTGATAINKPVDGAYAPAGGISPPEASLPAGEALSPGAFTGSLPSSLAPGGELFAPQPSIATPPPTPAAAVAPRHS